MAEKTQRNPNEISKDEVLRLARQSRAGSADAREQLILSHMYLAETLAKMNAGRGVEYKDLYQDACYGLLLAVDRFDPDRGYLFTTYATHWINKEIKRALRTTNQNRPIVPEESAFYDIQKYQQALTALTRDLGRAPTDEEVATRMKKTPKAIRRLRLRNYSFISKDSGELNIPADLPAGAIVRHMIPHYKLAPSAGDEALRAMGEHEQAAILSCLTPRQREIVLRYHGFSESGRTESFREISAAIGCSTETVRLDYHEAANKLLKFVYPSVQQPAGPQGKRPKPNNK